MKKTFIALTLAVMLITAFTFSVYADTNTAVVPQWFKDMITWKKDQINKAVQAGQLTEEQAKLYYERLNQMEQFHTKNGFQMMRGFGGCGGGFNNPGNVQNSNNSFGTGMMGRGY